MSEENDGFSEEFRVIKACQGWLDRLPSRSARQRVLHYLMSRALEVRVNGQEITPTPKDEDPTAPGGSFP